MRILLTGATGFVGGRLLGLLRGQATIRCLVRDPAKAKIEATESVEVVKGDTLVASSLDEAMRDVDVAYYLIHAMSDDGDFQEQDRQSAQNFLKAAEKNGVGKIIYLSGLAQEDDNELSEHLASRLEVGRILRGGDVPCLEFRAAMIIGEGSLSFRMVEHLCGRLPLMICPKWLSTPTQPIAVEDLMKYLLAAKDAELPESKAIEIGGADQTTYLKILKEYCRQKGLKRIMIPVPLLTPQLSSHWLAFVTPETAKVGRDLIDGLVNPTVVRDDSALNEFAIRPMSISHAIEEAIAGNPTLQDAATFRGANEHPPASTPQSTQ